MKQLASNDLGSELLEVLPPAIRAIRKEMRRLAQPELTVAQFRILTRLDIRAHSNKELADWMGISPASMCRTIDVLVKRGYVTRDAAKEDRRGVELSLTAKGKGRFDSIARATRQMLQKRIAPLGPADQEKLRTGLALIRQVLLEGIVD